MQMKMEGKNYLLLNEDCRQGIKNIPDISIDFIVTDPPYFIDGMDDEWNDKELKSKASKSGVVGMKFDRTQEKICKIF